MVKWIVLRYLNSLADKLRDKISLYWYYIYETDLSIDDKADIEHKRILCSNLLCDVVGVTGFVEGRYTKFNFLYRGKDKVVNSGIISTIIKFLSGGDKEDEVIKMKNEPENTSVLDNINKEVEKLSTCATVTNPNIVETLCGKDGWLPDGVTIHTYVGDTLRKVDHLDDDISKETFTDNVLEEIEVKPDTNARQTKIGEAYELIPIPAIKALARVRKEGSIKYGPNNHFGISCEEHCGRAIAHIYNYLSGDTSEEHLEHAFTRIALAIDVREHNKNQ